MEIARDWILTGWLEWDCKIVSQGVYYNHYGFLKRSWMPASLAFSVRGLINEFVVVRKNGALRLVVEHGSSKQESACKEVDADKMFQA